jgi:hypothetical protein
VEKLARHFAERVWVEAGREPQKQIDQAYWIALGRPPTEEEKKVSLEGMSRLMAETAKSPIENNTAAARAHSPQDVPPSKTTAGPDIAGLEQNVPKALQNFCHALVNSGAFMYVD